MTECWAALVANPSSVWIRRETELLNSASTGRDAGKTFASPVGGIRFTHPTPLQPCPALMTAPIATPVPPASESLELPEKPLTTGEWFVTLLVLALPLVGLVMYFVWGFGAGNISRRNFCRAALIWLGIGLGLAVLTMIAILIFGGTLAAVLSQSAPRR